MNIFVTGGTGFIGSHFIRIALNAGHTVVAQRRPGSQARIALEREPHWIDRPLDGDFNQELADCNVLVHLAAHTPNPPYAPLDECLYWNVFATVQLLQQAVNQGISDMLIAGSCFEYGLAAEGQNFIHPRTQPKPIHTYPISKAAASISCLGMARQLGLRLQLLRIFQVYGDGEATTRLWPSMKLAAKSNLDFHMSAGTQIRDFISVHEVAKFFLQALDFSGVEPGRPHIRNIGSGVGQSVAEFAQYWWGKWNAKGELKSGSINPRPDEFQRLVANIREIAIG